MEELARWTPASITAWRFRRLLKASYWRIHLLVTWWAEEALHTLPPPQDGTLHLVGDGSEKPKRGTQNPLAQKGRKSEHHPWFFGIRFALLIATWDVYRLPVVFRLIRPKNHPAYQTEKSVTVLSRVKRHTSSVQWVCISACSYRETHSLLASAEPPVVTEIIGLCRKFCSGGHEGAVAPVCVGLKQPGSRTVQPQ